MSNLRSDADVISSLMKTNNQMQKCNYSYFKFCKCARYKFLI